MEGQVKDIIRSVDVINFDWASDLCKFLNRFNGSNEAARKEVMNIVEEVKEEFKWKLDKWIRDFGYEEARPLSEKLIKAATILVERFDEAAKREFCATLKTVAIMLDTLREIHSIK